jgi:hypothetical protein
MAFDLKPTQAAAEALTDRWRWLRGAAIAFHPQRPCLGLSAIGLPCRFYGAFAGMSWWTWKKYLGIRKMNENFIRFLRLGALLHMRRHLADLGFRRYFLIGRYS